MLNLEELNLKLQDANPLSRDPPKKVTVPKPSGDENPPPLTSSEGTMWMMQGMALRPDLRHLADG